MSHDEVEQIVSCLNNRRDAMSIKAARCIRMLQGQVSEAFGQGWDGGLSAAINQLHVRTMLVAISYRIKTSRRCDIFSNLYFDLKNRINKVIDCGDGDAMDMEEILHIMTQVQAEEDAMLDEYVQVEFKIAHNQEGAA